MRYLLILLGLAVAAALPPGAAAQTREVIVPGVRNGLVRDPVHHQTTFRLVNLAARAAEATLEAYTADGVPIRVLELFPVPREGTETLLRLPPLGAVEVATAGDVPALFGWARVATTPSVLVSAEVALLAAPPGPHPICVRPSTEVLASLAVPGVEPARRWAGVAAVRPYRRTGYAVVNPSTTLTAAVEVSVLDGSGRLAATATLRIPPRRQVAGLVSDLPTAPADLMGSLRLLSDIPVAAAGAAVLLPGGTLTGLPFTALPEPGPCPAVIAPARNPLTGACREFPTPCEVPAGWEAVPACP